MSVGACEVCRSQQRTGHDLTPVVWSHVYQAVAAAGSSDPRLLQLQKLAEDRLVETDLGVARPTLAASDIVVCVSESTNLVRDSLNSVLEQQNAAVFLHLVRSGAAADDVIEEFRSRPEVRHHTTQHPGCLYRSVQELLPTLSTEFITLHDQHCIARPMHVAASVQRLLASGDAIVGSAMGTPQGVCEPVRMWAANGYYSPWQTLTLRRSVLVDMDGFCTDDPSAVTFLDRAARDKRRVGRLRMVTVNNKGTRPPAALPSEETHQPEDPLPDSGMGFPLRDVACDVVLPFRDHLDYVRESLDGLLNQTRCRTVIHLVDDDSRNGCDALFEEYSSHPAIRLYRNTRNIGQFTSFNNIVQFAETPFIAVQDADDISQPERLWRSVNVLNLTQADIFGSAVELFGAEQTVTPNRQGDPELQHRTDVRYSFYPVEAASNYFLENPTAVFRVSSFQALGGFADFGSVARNRASLDTEFYIRAHHAGAGIIVSQRALVRYRCHEESATQNADTGWGTNARMDANAEVMRRSALMRAGAFDPRVFGAIGRYQNVTQRVQ